ncbi:MAG: hypothetical protein ACK476_10025 [Fluviicola sp.]
MLNEIMRNLLLLFILSLSFASKAQLSEYKGYVGLNTSFGTVDQAKYYTIGFKGECTFKSRLGLLYNFEFVKRNDKIWNLHSSVGSVGGPLIALVGILADGYTNNFGFNTNLGRAGIVAGVVMFVMPEGVTYHFPIQYNWDVAPYVNVLGLDYVRDQVLDQGRLKWSGSAGVKTSYWTTSGFSVNVYFEARKVASYGINLGAGVGVGYSFKRFEDSPETAPSDGTEERNTPWIFN